MITRLFSWLIATRKKEQLFIPTAQEKHNAYFEISKALNFYAMTGFHKATIKEIAKKCPTLSENGIGTRLPEMKRKGYFVDCEIRPGTRCKQWWLTEAVDSTKTK